MWNRDDTALPPLAEETDEALVERVRAGDIEAYGVLWRRHSGVALSQARTFRDHEPEEIVSEAFEQILVAIMKGKGPRGSFRPYLIASLRNAGRRRFKRDIPRAWTDFNQLVDERIRGGEAMAITEHDRSAARTAFRSLPARWQEALWYSRVEGLKPREMAVVMGLSANGVSALVRRARQGFRDAWISSQLAEPVSPECQATVRQLGTHTRDGLSRRPARALTAHIARCDSCTAAATEAHEIARTLSVVLPAMAAVTRASPVSPALKPDTLQETPERATALTTDEHPAHRTVSASQ